jgi:hypothetical protein
MHKKKSISRNEPFWQASQVHYVNETSSFCEDPALVFGLG